MILILLSACAEEAAPPNTVLLHRLNRAEYDNTVRDLLGTPSSPADRFVADDRAFGFDNVVEAQRLAPVQVELYAEAAASLAEEVASPWPSVLIDGTELDADTGARWRDVGWRLAQGTIEVSQPPGRYRWAIRAFALSAPIEMRIGDRIEELGEPRILTGEGDRLEISLIDPGDGAVIDWIRFDALDDRVRPLFTCEPSRECAEEIVGRTAYRGFRRALREGELARLMSLFDAALDEGEPFEAAVGRSIEAILLSPSFLFRSTHRKLDPYQLASRLSYFVWNSMPDDALLARARAGELSLERELDRMLESPKASAMIESFTGQWLFGRALPEEEASLKREQQRFFAHLVANDRPIEELLTADYGFTDEGRVASEPPRRGVLGQRAVLVATSLANRTSPTKRGKFVMGQLLCSEPPPPPPDVPPLAETSTAEASPRRMLEIHRSRPECAGCHATMDPIGFGLEVFDRLGNIRSEDRGWPIDPSGTLPDGSTFEGPHELAEILSRRDDFRRCVARQMATYALGRGLRGSDEPLIDRLSQIGGWRRLIEAVVTSEEFGSEP